MAEVIVEATRAVGEQGNVLLVDDEPQVLSAYGRVLRNAGFQVTTLARGEAVPDVLAKTPIDVVVSDIQLPGMDGIEILKLVHGRDPDLPVVLMTAGGELTSAVKAVEHGAARYLLKPVSPELLCETVGAARRLGQLASVQRRAFELFGGAACEEANQRDLERRFETALDTLYPAFQPVIRWSDKSVFAHEALARTREQTLASPDNLFAAAEKLGRLFDVGREMRRLVAATIRQSDARVVFVNLHPADLEDETLYWVNSPLSSFARRVVLEITERASLGRIADLRERLAGLRKVGYRVAVDDLGAGYAGLNWFVRLEPEVVKLDMSLTRDIHLEPKKQKLIESMARLCGELDIAVVAEGVETLGERNALVAAGCDLLQGYFFAKPGRAFPVPQLDD
ncbi:MAG TPA: EAL domain-containing response regulator [Polyangiaceae bacterium]|nr:EAL domain-containing response regulator [Polyangiaceae bacterium]